MELKGTLMFIIIPPLVEILLVCNCTFSMFLLRTSKLLKHYARVRDEARAQGLYSRVVISRSYMLM